MTTRARRGARHPDLVPVEVMEALARGAESANHMEQIAMDMGALLTSQFPSLSLRAAEVRGIGLVARMRAGGVILYEELGIEGIGVAGSRSSDTVRGWAAMAVGQAPGLTVAERLDLIAPYADDAHFAVREWAWLSVRPHLANDVPGAVAALIPWTAARSEYLRRFASEVTRPRGVWSQHLPALKAEPDIGLPLLEPLRSDPSRYVRNSVANWLNDASKSSPQWVRSICERWLEAEASESTRWICGRACRTLRKR